MVPLLVVAVVALFANSAVDRTDDALPWEVTLAGFVAFGIIFAAIYAKKTEIALSACAMIFCVVPTYYVHSYEVKAKNWELGSAFSLGTSQADFVAGLWRLDRNASRFDVPPVEGALPAGLPLTKLSLFAPGISLEVNSSEIYHSGIQLNDPLTKEKSHDYLMVSSPRRVKEATVGIMLLVKVPAQFDLWPKEVEDYTFNLMTASNIVAPPTLTGELVKMDKGPAIESLKEKHHLRPFILDVYRVDYNYGG